MIVLGIDPSLTASAIASSDGWTLTFGINGKRTDTYNDRLRRINAVASDVTNTAEAAGLALIEGPSYRSADPSAWDRAALWWKIYDGLTERGVPIAVVPPACRAMYATGKGNAAKNAVVDAVARRWPHIPTGGDHNVCDAIVLMAMGCDRLGHPLTPVPATHRRALDRVAWPAGLDEEPPF